MLFFFNLNYDDESFSRIAIIIVQFNFHTTAVYIVNCNQLDKNQRIKMQVYIDYARFIFKLKSLYVHTNK